MTRILQQRQERLDIVIGAKPCADEDKLGKDEKRKEEEEVGGKEVKNETQAEGAINEQQDGVEEQNEEEGLDISPVITRSTMMTTNIATPPLVPLPTSTTTEAMSISTIGIAVRSSSDMSPRTRRTTISTHVNITLPKERTLASILGSPKFPDNYYTPVCKIMEATGRIRIVLRAGPEDGEGMEDGKMEEQRREVRAGYGDVGGMGKKLMWTEVKAIWNDLDVTADVISAFTSEAERTLEKTKERMRAAPNLGNENTIRDRTKRPHDDLLELLSWDDVLKFVGMYYMPSFTVDIYTTILSHLLSLKMLLSRSAPIFPYTTNNVSTAQTTGQPHSSITIAELLGKSSNLITAMRTLIHTTTILLDLNSTIKHNHLSLCRLLQDEALHSKSEQTKPTKECLVNLSNALKIVRSINFAPDSRYTEWLDIHASNNGFYRSLIPVIKMAKGYVKYNEEFGWSRCLEADKGMLLPFYLELMRYTRGVVDESPLSKLGAERGIGVGMMYGGGSDSGRAGYCGGLLSEGGGIVDGGGRQAVRRLSLSAGTALVGYKEGVKDGLREIMGKAPEDDRQKNSNLKQSHSSIWKWKIPSFIVSNDADTAEDANNGWYMHPSGHLVRSIKKKATSTATTKLSSSLAVLTKCKSASTPVSVSTLSPTGIIPGGGGGRVTYTRHVKTSNGGSGYGPSSDGTGSGSNHADENCWNGGGYTATLGAISARCPTATIVSEERRGAQDEWEELAMMLHGQKCMCKLGWMAGMRGKGTMGPAAERGGKMRARETYAKRR